MATCPDRSELERYHDGELSAEDSARIEDHLEACPGCAERLNALRHREDALVGDLRDLDTRFLGNAEPSAGGPRGHSLPEDPAPHLDIGAPAPSNLRIPGYEIIREIHRGGQGVVYLALQKTTRRKVAVKVLLDGSFATPSAKKRFEREVALAAQLKHPNIITIFDSGVTADGHQYCVMDYVNGEPLATHVRKNKLAMEDALRLFSLVCRGVHYAHQHGVIHRDLKSSNILVDRVSGDSAGVESDVGTPRILDFGLAKSLHNQVQTLVSITGEIQGTLPYMAPEQIRGDPQGVDARADVYALGIVLYEMLTGRYPYPVNGLLPEIIQHITETAPTPPRLAWTTDSGIGFARRHGRSTRIGLCPIDDEIDTILLRCLAKERGRRYQSAEALADDVDRYLAGEAIQAKRESRMYMLRKSLPRQKFRITMGTAILIAITGVTLVSALRSRVAGQKEQARATLIQQVQDAILVMDSQKIDQLMQGAKDIELDEANYHCYLGWARVLELETEATITEANLAIAANPKHAMSYYLRAAANAYRQDYIAAASDFAAAEQFKGDTILESGVHAMLKGLLGQYDSCIADLDELVRKNRGMAAPLWIRGFSRWYRLLTKPPMSLDLRWQIAQDSLKDLDAAAQLYPEVPFVFDVRADLFHHLAFMSKARGDERGFEEYQRRRTEDANTMIKLEAVGNGEVVHSEMKLRDGLVEEALRHAEKAYVDLVKPSSIRSVNRGEALWFSAILRLWATWLIGDDAATLALLGQVQKDHPIYGRYLVFGFVMSALADPANAGGASRRNAVMTDKSNLGPPYPNGSFGLWAGAMFRGDTELAASVAARFSVGLIDRIGWSGVWHRYLLGEIKEDAFLRAAGDDVDQVQLAHITIALATKDPAKRTQHLQAVLDTAAPTMTAIVAQGLLYKMAGTPSQQPRP